MTIFLMMPPANRHIAWPHIEKFAVLKITLYTAFLTMIDSEQALRYGMAPAGKGFNMRVYIERSMPGYTGYDVRRAVPVLFCISNTTLSSEDSIIRIVSIIILHPFLNNQL